MEILESRHQERWMDEVGGRLVSGALIAYPTETYYALGCHPRLAPSVRRLADLKGRSLDHPFPLVAATVGDALKAVVLDPSTQPLWQELVTAFWPGALTLVLPARGGFAPPVASPSGRIGIRVSSRALARRLAAAAGGLLVATSANKAGGSPVLKLQELGSLAAGLDLGVAAGETRGGPPSTVLDLTGGHPRLLRQGAITAGQIGERLGTPPAPAA